MSCRLIAECRRSITGADMSSTFTAPSSTRWTAPDSIVDEDNQTTVPGKDSIPDRHPRHGGAGLPSSPPAFLVLAAADLPEHQRDGHDAPRADEHDGGSGSGLARERHGGDGAEGDEDEGREDDPPEHQVRSCSPAFVSGTGSRGYLHPRTTPAPAHAIGRMARRRWAGAALARPGPFFLRRGAMESSQKRVLIVANRTAATPTLMEEIERRVRQEPTTFALLIPDSPSAEHTDWTLELALPLLERASRGPVEGLSGSSDPFEAIREAVGQGNFDEI